MQAHFTAVNHSQLTLDMTFEDFLGTGVMARQAQAAMCSPEDLIRDYVREDTARYGDDGEIAEEFGEAAVLASDFAVNHVELDTNDIAFVRGFFGLGLRRVPFGISPEAA